jgi:hypothetical protein
MRNIVFAMALLICFAVPAVAADLNAVSGTYYNKRDDTKFLTLRNDGSFTLKQRKDPPDKDDPFVEFSGKYQLNGETLKLTVGEGENAGTAEGKLKGSVFTDSQNEEWVKKSTEQKNVERVKPKRWW